MAVDGIGRHVLNPIDCICFAICHAWVLGNDAMAGRCQSNERG